MMTRTPSRLVRSIPLLLSLAPAAVVCGGAVFVWNGGGGDALWSNDANWAGGVAPGSGATVVFDGIVQTLVDHDLAAGTDYNLILFTADADAFTITGNRIAIVTGGRITNESSLLQTFEADVEALGGLAVDAANGAFLFSGVVQLGPAAALTVGGDFDTTISGVINGSGALVKTGSGTLHLTGASPNAFSGQVLVTEGTLLLEKPVGALPQFGSAIQGDLTISAAGTVRLAQSNQVADTSTVTLNGGTLDLGAFADAVAAVSINGGGTIEGDAGGTGLGFSTRDAITTDGTGAVTISANLFLLPSVAADTDPRRFVIGADAPVTVSGVIADGPGGAGVLRKSGTGTLTLEGDNTYSGGTNLAQGTLILAHENAAGTGDMTLNGGTLLGAAMFGGDLTLNSGRIDLGNGMATISVAGNVALNGGTWDVEIDNSGNSDAIASATASITGGTIRAVPIEPISFRWVYPILQTTGGLTGDADDLARLISDTSFLLDFSLQVDGNELQLIALPVSTFVAAIAGQPNPNLSGIAAILDNAVLGGEGGAELAAVQMFSQEDIVRTVGDLQPQVHQANAMVLRRQHRAIVGNWYEHLAAKRAAVRRADAARMRFALADADGGSEALRAAVNGTDAPPASRAALTGWVRTIGDWGRFDADLFAAGYRWRMYGADAGVESMVSDTLLLGASLASLWSRVDGSAGTGSADATSLHGRVYGSWIDRHWHVDAGISYGHAWNTTKRSMTALGTTGRGDSDSDLIGAFIGAGRVLPFFGWDIEPYARAEFTWVRAGGYTEEGAGIFNLEVASTSSESLRHVIGVQATRPFLLRDGSTLRPYAGAAWEFEYLDRQIETEARLLGAAFRVRSGDAGRSSGRVNAGAEWHLPAKWSLVAEYSLTASSEWHGQTAYLGARFEF